MLNELETLSQNIGRLIEINQRQHEARLALEEQLAQLRAQCDETRAELEQVREERAALQAERDALSAKIDDAQVRLNAILEKLPRARAGNERDNQLDLLEPSQSNDDSNAARHGENA
ncbi:ATPase [Paraburkholderia sp. CNPSo 3274]|uniref:ATPase n=1 Tax=Paraburkholderia sp. CNPSo 3274 TaxID=2940932 RepID=UPI0020B890AA|nr:ATPase [Paraburkholderia sp. CNPSo 3274]MCP3708902.1 ATPase [Paraburkholderia sp. CNPSo 3274]